MRMPTSRGAGSAPARAPRSSDRPPRRAARIGSRAMRLALPIVWSDRHRLHEPGGEIWAGVRTPGTEVPERAERIRAALEGARFVEARPQPPEALLAVHDGELVD